MESGPVIEALFCSNSWSFTPEHLQDPDKVADCLKEN